MYNTRLYQVYIKGYGHSPLFESALKRDHEDSWVAMYGIA